MADKTGVLPAELSRGMKQKLAIACGLIHSPRVILFDEPLTGLDPIGIRRMKATILRRAREGASIIISSHLLPLLEEVCSHVPDPARRAQSGRRHAGGDRAAVPRPARGRRAAGSGGNLLRATGQGSFPPTLDPAQERDPLKTPSV